LPTGLADLRAKIVRILAPDEAPHEAVVS
jgi:hypothetical protein